MATSTVTYEGELRCALTHDATGTTVATDAPVDNRGRGECFSPTDLVASATAACMLTIMGIRAADRGWDLGAARATVNKHMVADPRRRIGRLEIAIAVPTDLDAEARAVLEEAARTCPVKESLHAGIELDLSFRWGA